MSDKTQTEKRPFDPAMSFAFFGSWFETLERLKESQGVEAAYNLFEAIANYSRYHDVPNFEDGSIAQIFWPMIQREIDLSLRRRGANFSSEETEKRRQKVISAHLGNPSLTMREIEELTGIPKSTVSRILQTWDDDGVEAEHEIDTEQEVEAEHEKEIEVEQEIDTMGLGQDGTVGQQKEQGKPHTSLLDKILDFLWEKHGYSKEMIEFDEDGKGVIDCKPALFYIPPSAWKQDDVSAATECPDGMWDRWDSDAGDVGLPF